MVYRGIIIHKIKISITTLNKSLGDRYIGVRMSEIGAQQHDLWYMVVAAVMTVCQMFYRYESYDGDAESRTKRINTGHKTVHVLRIVVQVMLQLAFNQQLSVSLLVR